VKGEDSGTPGSLRSVDTRKPRDRKEGHSWRHLNRGCHQYDPVEVSGPQEEKEKEMSRNVQEMSSPMALAIKLVLPCCACGTLHVVSFSVRPLASLLFPLSAAVKAKGRDCMVR